MLSNLPKKEYWKQVCERYVQSGLTKAEFCRQQKVSETQLYYWSSIIKAENGARILNCSRLKFGWQALFVSLVVSMLSLNNFDSIYLYRPYTDFRKGPRGLAALVQDDILNIKVAVMKCRRG